MAEGATITVSNLERLAQLQEMPKAELHVHLDGSIPAEIVFSWWQKLSKPILLPEKDRDGNLIVYSSYQDRIVSSPEELKRYWANWTKYSIPDRFGVVTEHMQTPENLRNIAKTHVLDLAEQNIVYAETRFAPQYSIFGGLSMPDVVKYTLQGLQQGMDEARQNGKDILVKLIVCIGREAKEDVGVQVAKAALEYQGMGVVALDLACYEPTFPPERHARAFQETFGTGLKRTVHAGEMMKTSHENMRNIYSAIQFLRADGIGHGIPLSQRYYMNGETDVLQMVKDRGIRVEANPISNLYLGFIDTPSDLHLDQLLKAGVLVTVNSDDPAMWPKGTLAHNLYVAEELYGRDAMLELNRNAIRAAF